MSLLPLITSNSPDLNTDPFVRKGQWPLQPKIIK